MRVKVPLYAVQSFFCTLAVCIPLMFLVPSLVRAYAERVAYPAYLETADIGPNSVGSAPQDDTPRPTSLAELRQQDRFAPIVLHYKAAERVGGRQYYILTLPSGETVIGHMVSSTDITPAGSTESGEPLYQLPISRWEEVEVPAGESGFVQGSYDDATHYIECVGEVTLTVGDLMEQNPVYRFFHGVWGFLFIGLYILFCLCFRRRAIAKQAARQ